MDMHAQTRMGHCSHLCLSKIFCQEGWMTMWKKLDQITVLIRKVVVLIFSLFFCRILVIQISHVVEVDESNHFTLGNY